MEKAPHDITFFTVFINDTSLNYTLQQSSQVLLFPLPLVGSMCPELPGRALQGGGGPYAEEEEEAEGEKKSDKVYCGEGCISVGCADYQAGPFPLFPLPPLLFPSNLRERIPV